MLNFACNLLLDIKMRKSFPIITLVAGLSMLMSTSAYAIDGLHYRTEGR